MIMHSKSLHLILKLVSPKPPSMLSSSSSSNTSKVQDGKRPNPKKYDNYHSLEQITRALKKSGLKSAKLILGIAFSMSNESTCFEGTENPYEKAISIIGKTLTPFDKENLIPCFGFGKETVTTYDEHVFSFRSDHAPCHGFQEVLDCYKRIVPTLGLSGPTSFEPIVKAAVDIVQKSHGQYHVLVIIADGQVAQSIIKEDEKQTINSIVTVSSYPLSIVLVGVGDGPWEDMQKFHDKIPARVFENFQFVNFVAIMSKNASQSDKKASFALDALMEIPLQYKACVELGLLRWEEKEWVVPELNIEEPIPIPSSEENIKTLWQRLNQESVGAIRIQGEPLMGKTWTARQLMYKAANHFDVSTWVDGNRKDCDIQMQIAEQLKLKFAHNCWVAEDVIKSKLRDNIFQALAGKRFLVILDDAPPCTLKELGVPDPKEQKKSSKVVLTCEADPPFEVDCVQMKKLSKEEAWFLFKEMTSLEVTFGNNSAVIHELVEPLLDNCQGTHLNIVTLAGTLRNLQSKSSSSSLSLLRSKLLANIQKACDLYRFNPKISRVQFLCEMLSDNQVKHCFFFCCIHPLYNQFSVEGLIASWMKAGFSDGSDCLEDTYKKGHNILQELIDRHLLIRRFDGMVCVQTQLISEVFDYIMNIGFDIQFFRRLSLAGGTGTNRKQQLNNPNLLLSYSDNTENDQSSLSLLLHGNETSIPCRLRDAFFEQRPHLRDVHLLRLAISSLPTSLSKLKCLNVLVVRGCTAVDNVNQITELHNLRILSLSGASKLKEIPDDFFKHMGDLESLNLSQTQLNQLPSSFSDLSGIRFLILQGYSNLETLPSMKQLLGFPRHEGNLR